MQTLNICDSKSQTPWRKLSAKQNKRNLDLNNSLAEFIEEFAQGFGFVYNHQDHGKACLEFICDNIDEASSVLNTIRDRLWCSDKYEEVNQITKDTKVFEDKKNWFYILEILQDGPLVVLNIDISPYELSYRKSEDEFIPF